MGYNREYLGGLLLACLSISQLAGCCCDDSCAGCGPETGGRPFRQDYACAGPACYGYHSTCWSPWPEECETCPPPARILASDEVGKEPSPAIAPDAPAELIPMTAKPMPGESVPPVPPEESPKPAEPKSAEPEKDLGPTPDSPTSPKPAAPARPLESKPPTTRSDSGNVNPQNYQTEPPAATSDPATASEAAIRRAVAYQRMMPRPVVISMASPGVLEADNGQNQQHVQMDQSLGSRFSKPGAAPIINGSLQSQRHRLR